jgi:TonB family protein
MTVAPAIGRVGNVGVSASPAPGRGETFGLAGISTSSSAAQIGDAPARLRAGTVPAYTPAALSASVEANVPLEIVVSESGAVTSARALEHVGYGLDEAAQQSILGYRFTPAMRNGKAIAVRMRWLMRFQLR